MIVIDLSGPNTGHDYITTQTVTILSELLFTALLSPELMSLIYSIHIAKDFISWFCFTSFGALLLQLFCCSEIYQSGKLYFHIFENKSATGMPLTLCCQHLSAG